MRMFLCAASVLLCLWPAAEAEGRQAGQGVETFWAKFQAAVAKDDKAAVASLTKFPLSMPYGVRSVKTKAEFLRTYGKIFDAETKKCFAKAKPEFEGTDRRKFYIGCGEAMMYWFEMVRGEYRFAAVDNINE